MHVLYEDNHVIVVGKDAGEIVQGDRTGDMPLSERVAAYLRRSTTSRATSSWACPIGSTGP